MTRFNVSGRPTIRNLESFTCLWLDQDVFTTDDNQQTVDKLRSVINYLLLFDNIDRCEHYIRRTTTEKIILIVSGALGRQIVPYIHDLSQLSACYIFCYDTTANKIWSSKYRKVNEYDQIPNGIVFLVFLFYRLKVSSVDVKN